MTTSLTQQSASEPAAHSNFIGGSNCAIRLNCPASYQMEARLPASARQETSAYADEGSALHAAMADILLNDLDPQDVLGRVYEPWTAFPITQEYIDEALKPCVDYFDKLDQAHDGLDFCVEKRVAFKGMPGVFGTTDLLAHSAYGTINADYKMGQGVQVFACYETDDGRVFPNEQLMLYTLMATDTHPKMFDLTDPDWPITLIIMQPRWREGPHFDAITVTVKDVWDFRDRLLAAAGLMKSDNPPMARGAWCRFAPCKAICPLWTGPLLDAVALEEAMTHTQLVAAVGAGGRGDGDAVTASVDWASTYHLMLTLASQIEPIIKEWRQQAQVWLEEGNTIPAWKLVPKRGMRKWTKSDLQVEGKLKRLGLVKDQRMPRSLISAPQAEKILQKLGKELPADYIDAVSSGLTLAPTSDKRQAVSVGDTAKALSANLAMIMARLIENGTLNLEEEKANG